MPTSAREGRQFFTDWLAHNGHGLQRVLDFGPGEGTYSILGRHLTPNASWKAVEIYEPYVERYDLDQKYDEILIGNMLNLDEPPYDLGIFGDVLEHVSHDHALQTLAVEASRANHLFVSVPIVPAPQGPSHGNEAEAHQYDWSFDEMTDILRNYGRVDSWLGHIVGRWWVHVY